MDFLKVHIKNANRKINIIQKIPTGSLNSIVNCQSFFREDIRKKKTFSFGHCPNHLNPPPPLDPNSGNLVLFFLRQKRRFARMTGKKIDADNEGCNDI